MKKRKRLIGILVILLCMLVSVPVSAATMINKKSATIYVGQSIQLKMTGTKSKVTWSSNKKAVATVSSSGKVVAKKSGTATITAKVGGKKFTCKVTVKSPKISATKINLYIGDYKKLTVTGGSGTVKWATTNKQVARVTPYGLVDARGCGSCKITATVNGIKLTCTVNVTVEDPECFPSKKLKIGNVTINSFEAKFVSYQVYKDYSKSIGVDSLTYYFPYKYRIKITGHTDANVDITLRFVFLNNGKVPDMPANNYIRTKADSNGNFTINKTVNFSSYGEMIYISSAITYIL